MSNEIIVLDLQKQITYYMSHTTLDKTYWPTDKLDN